MSMLTDFRSTAWLTTFTLAEVVHKKALTVSSVQDLSWRRSACLMQRPKLFKHRKSSASQRGQGSGATARQARHDVC